jgi:transposase InsO family protein
MFLLLIDAHSKWPEIVEMPSTTASRTVDVLHQIFAHYGIPEQIVSDNGPQFVSEEFSKFMKENAIKHVRILPYHPASNGAAERLVQTFKQAMRATDTSGLPFQQRLNNFLFSYRSTPHSTKGDTPSKLFLGREIRSRFDLLLPDVGHQVRSKQAVEKVHHDATAKTHMFDIGAAVTVKDAREPTKWKRGIVLQQLGPVSYLVRLETGQVRRKHVDHVRELRLPTWDFAVTRSRANPGGTTTVDITSHDRRYPLRDRRPVERFQASACK